MRTFLTRLALSAAISLGFSASSYSASVHYLPPSEQTVVANQQQAQQFISDYLDYEHQFAFSRHGLAGQYLSFYPLVAGLPVFNLVDSLALDSERSTFRIYQSQPDLAELTIPALPDNIAPDLQQVISQNALPFTIDRLLSYQHGWFWQQSQLIAGWRLEVSAAEALPLQVLYVSTRYKLLERGVPVSEYQAVPATPISGESVLSYLFETNPRTALQDNTLVFTGPDMVLNDAAYQQVTLRDVQPVDGGYQLSGPYAQVVDLYPPHIEVELAQAEQFLRRHQPGFVQQMAYYHIDSAQRHLQALGFSASRQLLYSPLQVDAQGLEQDQSAYSRYDNRILLGTGGVPDGEDASVIWHEYAHAITWFISPFMDGADSGAIGEGFADYFAAMHNFRQPQSRLFEPEQIFNWDGRFSPRSPRTLADLKARYNPYYYYPAHVTVQGTLGDQLWSTPLFQATMAAWRQYGDSALQDMEQLLLESFYGLGNDLRMDQLAVATLDIARRMFPQRDYSVHLQQAFTLHRLLPSLLAVEARSSTENPQQFDLVLTGLSQFDLQNIGLTTSSHDVTLTPVSGVALAGGATTVLPQVLTVNNALSCGAELDVALNAQYQTLIPVLDKQQFMVTLQAGEPRYISQSAEGRELADARGRDNGAVQAHGVTTFTLAVTDEFIIDQHFSVQLSLLHGALDQLQISLTSPAGTKIPLWNKEFYPHPAFDFSLPSEVASPDFSALQGQQLKGNWQLQIVDSVPGEQGSLLQWGISQRTGFDCPEPQPEPQPEPVTPQNNSSGGSTGYISLLLLLLSVYRQVKRKNT